jgi:hypothetical protein
MDSKISCFSRQYFVRESFSCKRWFLIGPSILTSDTEFFSGRWGLQIHRMVVSKLKRRDFVIEFVSKLFDATDFPAPVYCIWYLEVFSRISFVSRAVDFVRLFLQLIDVANDDTDSL